MLRRREKRGEKRGLQNLRQDPRTSGTGAGEWQEAGLGRWERLCPGQVVTGGAGWGRQLCLLTGEKGRSRAAVVH